MYIAERPAQIAAIPMLPAVKGGRCWNGAHRDAGQIIHLVPAMPTYSSGDWFYKAVCGTEPGRRSYGWNKTDKDANCPKCLKRYAAGINGR